LVAIIRAMSALCINFGDREREVSNELILSQQQQSASIVSVITVIISLTRVVSDQQNNAKILC
jgi:hypothetical protein